MLVISDSYFGEGMEPNSAGEKVKKERNDKILSKTMCTHCKWANEQTLKLWLVFDTLFHRVCFVVCVVLNKYSELDMTVDSKFRLSHGIIYIKV